MKHPMQLIFWCVFAAIGRWFNAYNLFMQLIIHTLSSKAHNKLIQLQIQKSQISDLIFGMQ